MLCKIFVNNSEVMHDYFFAYELINKITTYNDIDELTNHGKACILISDKKENFEVFYNNNIITLPKSLFYYKSLVN